MEYEANLSGPALFIFGQAFKPGAIIPGIKDKLEAKTFKALLDSERITPARARQAPRFEGERKAPEDPKPKTPAKGAAADPKDKLTQEDLKGKEIGDLNLMAAERGYKGEPFEKVGEAKLWLTANAG